MRRGDWWRIAYITALACLLAWLGIGCTATTVKMYPPAELTADCSAGLLEVRTNEELAVTAVRLAGALKLCNIDKQKLREWSQD